VILFAKLKAGAITFPYDYMTLQRDNPLTDFGDRIDVDNLFPATDEATTHGATLVPVQMPEQPIFNHFKREIRVDPNPTLSEGVWRGLWYLVDIPPGPMPEGYKPPFDFNVPGGPPDVI